MTVTPEISQNLGALPSSAGSVLAETPSQDVLQADQTANRQKELLIRNYIYLKKKKQLEAHEPAIASATRAARKVQRSRCTLPMKQTLGRKSSAHIPPHAQVSMKNQVQSARACTQILRLQQFMLKGEL